MGVYHVVVGVGTIVFISLLWVIYAQQIDMFADIFTAMVPAHADDYAFGSKTMYFSLFFIVVVILLWIYKTTAEEQEKKGFYE